MDDSLLMRRIQSRRDLPTDTIGAPRIHRLGADALPEGAPGDELHGDEVGSTFLFEGIDDGDVGMTQLRENPGFLSESRHGRRAEKRGFGDHLDRDATLQARVLG
jgi:hypothetical protein